MDPNRLAGCCSDESCGTSDCHPRTALRRSRTAGMIGRKLPEIWKGGTRMDRLEAMSVIIAVTETGSISASSRRLKSPVATVSRKVAELETRLKAQLF